jgi:hypothetical protein
MQRRSAQYYREQAERCLKLAETAETPARRQKLQDVAGVCEELAELIGELEKSAAELRHLAD